MSRQKSVPPQPSVSWNSLLNVFILLLAFFVLLPQIDRFNTSLASLREAGPMLVLLAFLAGMSTLLFAALTYVILAANKLRYARTLAVQIAGTFTNRLLPAGLGGMGINIRYLTLHGFTAGAATSVAAANNLLGFAGHATLAASALVISGRSPFEAFRLDISMNLLVIGFTVLLLIGMVLLLSRRLRHRLGMTLRDTARQLLSYRRQPLRLMAALLSSITVTLLYAACLFICIRAVGLQLGPLETFLAFSLGVAAGTVTPTPGGLIGVEAGILAGMVGYGLPEAPALSAVLLYRLITYWLPILPGFMFFRLLRQRRLL